MFLSKPSSLLLLIAGLLVFLPSIYGWVPFVTSSRYSSKLCSADTRESAAPDSSYYSYLEAPVMKPQSSKSPPITLERFLHLAVKNNPELRDLEFLYLAIQMACKTISNLVGRAGLNGHEMNRNESFVDGRFYSMKRLDQLSTLVLKNSLKFTGKCRVVEPSVVRTDSESPAQHQPGVLIAKSLLESNTSYVACLDPLDGSGNADASICTGTVFGVFQSQFNSTAGGDVQTLVDSVLQPAKNMRAAGYCLYSSATVLVFTLGSQVQGFTLDPQTNEFVLTHPNLTIPATGNVYSCNEGNSEGWDESFRNYIKTIKTGKGWTGQRYAPRYVGSMVGDIHRTLLYGGIFAYPSDKLNHPDGNLQLLYKTAPMAFVVSKAGGTAIDGRTGSLLNVTPARVHQKSPCFMGSPQDVKELETYLDNLRE